MSTTLPSAIQREFERITIVRQQAGRDLTAFWQAVEPLLDQVYPLSDDEDIPEHPERHAIRVAYAQAARSMSDLASAIHIAQHRGWENE